MLLAPFAAGMLVAFWAKFVPVHWALGLLGLGIALYTYAEGGWNAGGQYGLLYFMMWGAISWTKLQNWERFGDFSYGVYIFAWPLMTFVCFFGLQEAGMLAYFAVHRGRDPRGRLRQLAPDREAGHVAQGLVAHTARRCAGWRGPRCRAPPAAAAPDGLPLTHRSVRPWPATAPEEGVA